MSALISVLFDRWVGRPILVLGGGPSVSNDLSKLQGFKPACVISANEHGTRQTMFPVDLIVNMDHNHCLKKVPMEKHLRPFGVPIVNRFSWADYRLPDWPVPANSGLAAVAVAAALGGNPVIVTGIDFFTSRQRYFYSKMTEVPRRVAHVHPVMLRRMRKQQVAKLAKFCDGAHVRPMSGPLQEFFPPYKPNEKLPPTKVIRYRRELIGVVPVIIEATSRFRFRGQDIVRPGQRIALSPEESRKAAYGAKCRRLASPT